MAVETQFPSYLDPAGVVALTRFRATATAAIRPALMRFYETLHEMTGDYVVRFWLPQPIIRGTGG